MPLVSCDKEEQGQLGDNSTYLPISDMENVYPLGDEVEVSFTSASSWSVKSPNWVTIKNKGGKEIKTGYAGTTPLIITIKPYIDENSLAEPSSQPRRGTLEFVTDAGTKTFEITQDRAYIKVVDSSSIVAGDMVDNDIVFDWSADEKYYTVESNVRWELDVNDNRVTVKVDDIEWESDMLYGQNESCELCIAVGDNFDGKLEANVSFIPRQPKNVKESFEVLERTLEVSQDYLYLKVFETLPYSSAELMNPGQTSITGISELGDQREFYVLYQENLEGKIGIQKSSSDPNVDLSCFEWESDEVSEEFSAKLDGERTIRWQKYNAKFLTANPDFDNNRTITLAITPKETNDSRACRSVNFVQNAYQFVIKENGDVVNREKEIPNAGDAEYAFTLETKGDWTISYDKAVNDWAELTFSDQSGDLDGADNGSVSGSGNATIGVEVANRNLSFDLDNVLNLAFEASNIKEDYAQANAQKSVDFKQPKFEFEISVREPDNTINSSTFNVSSHTTKEYDVLIESSGSWRIVEESDWVTFDGSVEGSGNNDEAGSLTFNANENDYSRDFVLKVISKEHEDVEGYEDNYYRELTITQDEIKTNILEYRNGPSMDGKSLSYVAYRKNSSDRESTFYMECSAPWKVVQKPSWVTLLKGSEVLSVGDGVNDGEYYTLSMVVDNNFNTQPLSGNVSFSVGSNKTIGFTISQDGFVFDVTAFNKTYAPVTTDVDELNVTLTNETEPDLSDIEPWVNLTENGTVDNGKTTTYKYLVKPGPNVETLNQSRGRDYEVAVSGIQSLSKNITIKQDKFEWQIDKSSLEFDVMGGVSSESIIINKCTKNGADRCYDFEYVNCNWLELSDPNSVGSNLLTFRTTSTNTSTTDDRKGKIRFFVKHPSISSKEHTLQEVDVKQDKYIWSVDYNGEYNFKPVYSKSSDYEGVIAIESSGKWKAESDNKDMVTLASTSGNGNKNDLKVTIKPNYTRSERTAVIEISNDDLGASSKQKIELKQEAYVFEADNNAVELEAAKDSSKSVSFTSSGSKGLTFEVYPTNSDWLKVENEDNELVITTLKENDATDNSATITVTDVESGLDVVIEVTQKAKAK